MAQNKNYSYIGVINSIEAFANAHEGVERFIADDEDQISARTSIGEEFPVLFLAPLYNYYGDTMNQYQFRIYCYDRILKDRTNVMNAKSVTDKILNDMDVWMKLGRNVPFDLVDITTATPISSELMDDVTGWYVEVALDSPNYGTCKIPFESEPEINEFDCE